MTKHLSISRRELIVGGLMVAFACSARARATTSEKTGRSAILLIQLLIERVIAHIRRLKW